MTEQVLPGSVLAAAFPVERWLLHLAALLLPLLALVGVLLAVGFKEGVTSALALSVTVVVPAQIAAYFGWKLLGPLAPGRTADAVLVGLFMTGVTHALFGPVFAAIAGATSPRGITFDIGLISNMVQISLLSALLVGWVTLPATIAVAVLINRRRGRHGPSPGALPQPAPPAAAGLPRP